MVIEALRCAAVRVCVLTAVFSFVSSSAADEEKDVIWPFNGCEADDVRSLAGVSGGSWRGQNHAIGPLTLRHHAQLDCWAGSCAARLGMEVARDGSSLPGPAIVPAPLALTLRGAHDGHQMRLDGAEARSLANGLGAAAFLDNGERHRVLLDQGVLAKSVWLRIRTVVSCSVDAEQCSISSDPVVYMPYDDLLKCGALASEAFAAF